MKHVLLPLEKLLGESSTTNNNHLDEEEVEPEEQVET